MMHKVLHPTYNTEYILEEKNGNWQHLILCICGLKKIVKREEKQKLQQLIK